MWSSTIGPEEITSPFGAFEQPGEPFENRSFKYRREKDLASRRVQERAEMIRTQISDPGQDRTAVRDRRVLEAILSVPRHEFVPEALQQDAYQDMPLPIGYDQTISQPYMVARMTELLRVEPESKVLEIGTGSGYQAAILGKLTPHVYTVEIVPELAARAKSTFRTLGYHSIRCRLGDGGQGWPEEAPFDRILLACACRTVPKELWKQLKPSGLMVYPEGEPRSPQWLVVAEKLEDEKSLVRFVMPVRFVPMIG
jgi:protein-L-isoaspartate(D-aspartate) O-methyltransferase